MKCTSYSQGICKAVERDGGRRLNKPGLRNAALFGQPFICLACKAVSALHDVMRRLRRRPDAGGSANHLLERWKWADGPVGRPAYLQLTSAGEGQGQRSCFEWLDEQIGLLGPSLQSRICYSLWNRSSQQASL